MRRQKPVLQCLTCWRCFCGSRVGSSLSITSSLPHATWGLKNTSQWQGTHIYMNELEDTYLEVVEKCTHDGVNTFTLMKRKNKGHTHEWHHYDYYNVVLRWLLSTDLWNAWGSGRLRREKQSTFLQGGRYFLYKKEQFIAANLWSEHAKCGYMSYWRNMRCRQG